MNVVEIAKRLLSPHDHRVDSLARAKARVAEAAARRQELIAAAEAEAARIREILERPARLRAENLGVGIGELNEIAALENELREHPPKELARFVTQVERLHARRRREGPPATIERHNQVTGAQVVVNADEIARWNVLAHGPEDPERPGLRGESVLARCQREIRDVLWKLPGDALSERLAALRGELEQALEGTNLEDAA